MLVPKRRRKNLEHAAGDTKQSLVSDGEEWLEHYVFGPFSTVPSTALCNHSCSRRIGDGQCTVVGATASARVSSTIPRGSCSSLPLSLALPRLLAPDGCRHGIPGVELATLSESPLKTGTFRIPRNSDGLVPSERLS